MRRFLLRVLVAMLGLFLALYLGDWVVLRVRISRQTAFRTIQVDQFLATPLKGEKEEYDYMGQADQPCVRSLFPHASAPPCWWLERHKTEWEH